jgi:hypothetical protein
MIPRDPDHVRPKVRRPDGRRQDDSGRRPKTGPNYPHSFVILS